jgi:broad specificity phosphatase PhoE
LNSSEKLGQKLKFKNYQPHYIYSSPAMRCILTTIQILKGLQLKDPIPIRIEPGLLEFGAARFGMNIFFQPLDWHKYGINIDLSYQPIITHIPPFEREDTYYHRSKHVIREIEKCHQHSSNELLNIFIIAHATSSETLTWDLIGRKPNINDLYKLSLNIAYLQMVITERQHENKCWSLKSIPWI